MLSINNTGGPGEGSSLKSTMISNGQAAPTIIYQKI